MSENRVLTKKQYTVTAQCCVAICYLCSVYNRLKFEKALLSFLKCLSMSLSAIQYKRQNGKICEYGKGLRKYSCTHQRLCVLRVRERAQV